MKTGVCLVMLVIGVCGAGCSGTVSVSQAGTARFVSAREFKALVDAKDPGTILLDVRTPKEYAEGHIAGARNIDFYDPGFKQQLAALEPATLYLVYCHSANRTYKTAAMMHDMGFKNVVVLDDGILEWIASKLPLER